MQNRISLKYQPIKDDAALHGRDIGKIGIGTHIIVDEKLVHDKWVPIVGPAPLGPLWLETEKQGWVELANTALEAVEQHQYLTTLAADGSVISCKQLS